MMRSRVPGALTAVFMTSAVAQAAEPFTDVLVQPPELAAPERGSVAGSYSKLDLGPAGVVRGAFTLAGPFDVPNQRGGTLFNVLPQYSPETGLTEWGMGWQVELSIRRHRVTGDLDYATDGFVSPWGRLVPGSDGYWYVLGLQSNIRLSYHSDDDTWTATADDGTRLTFGERVANPSGTYAWYFTQAESVLGAATEATYVTNLSGRRFLNSVTFGAQGHIDTYRLVFDYEAVSPEIVSYASGHAMTLDRRVQEVTVEARHGGDGAYQTRWFFALDFRESQHGPAYFLENVTKTYASGESEPAFSYEYNYAAKHLEAATFEHISELDEYLSQNGASALRHDEVTYVDADSDGVMDIEHSDSYSLFRHTAVGWLEEPLPEPPLDVDGYCRSSEPLYNIPRTLTRLTGDPMSEPEVLVTIHDYSTYETIIRVCNREGSPGFEQQYSGRWDLSANIRLADLNRDHRPDLVAFWRSGGLYHYQVLENTSDTSGYGFVEHPVADVDFDGVFSPEGTWVHDANGDGLPDLVVRGLGGRLVVLYGQGQFRFSAGIVLPLIDWENHELISLTDKGLYLFDANKDGLVDALLTKVDEARLFIHQGTVLHEVTLESLGSLGADLAVPVTVDLRGRGNAEIVYTLDHSAYSLELNTAKTSLLSAADDGKGTVLRFAYGRASPHAGVASRVSVMTRVTVERSGYEAYSSEYSYDAPTVHTEGRFLIGFDWVQKQAPLLTETVWFHHDDEVSGVVLYREDADSQTPEVIRFEDLEYDDRVFQGVRWKRPLSTYKGWMSADTSVQMGEIAEYLTYERERCATAVQTTSQHGRLKVETELANVTLLGEAWHCLPATETVTGSHLDASLDFVMEQEVLRNDYGQPYRVEQRGDGSSLTVQEIGYTPDHKIHTVSRPGRGVTTVTYDTSTGLLATAIAHDGVERTVESRDAITDALLGITQDRGPGGLLEMSYRFDGQERLWKSWDDFAGATESEPATEVRYGYATSETPAFVWSTELVNVASGSVRDSVSYLTAAGEEYASAIRMPNAWQVPELTVRHPSDGTTQEYRRTPLDAALGPEAVGYSDLGGGLVYLGEAQAAGFDYTPYAHRMVATGVEQTVTTGWSLANDAIVQSTIENESSELQTVRAVDAGGRVLWSGDQAGNVTAFDYDALGRMVGVRLPDEAAHLIRYDAFGRPSTVVRDGVGSIAYEYQALTGLLGTAYFSGTDGVLERTVDYQYDDIGRLETATHTLASTGETEVYRYAYDGSHESPPAPGQLGHLTRVEGSGYVRTSSFNRDDSLRQSRWVLADWRELVTSWTYNVDGSAHSITRQVLDASTQEFIEETEQVFVYDPYGRLEEHWINSQAGSTCLTYSYDDDGLLDGVTVTGGDALTYSYDGTTHAPDGYSQTAQSNTATVEWTFNARGLVERELLSVGADEWDRGYLYESRGFLESATDAHGTAVYSYSPTGMPETTSDLLGTRSLMRIGNEMLVGDEPYVYDHLGRVVVKGNRQLRYGPTGDVAVSRTVDGSIPSPEGRLLFVSLDGITVVAPLPTEWRYAYDEAGNRILKSDGSRPVAGYVEGGYLQDSGFVEPIRVAGRVVGIVEGGAFRMLATDPRGTLMADSSGQPNIATAYGVRAERPDLSPVLDYVEKGYDSDLGTVRFGVRDYDPFIGQWLSADPLFLEQPKKCLESPLECNLYSYAGNSPVALTDPAGLAIYNIVVKGAGANIFGHNITLHVNDDTKEATFYEVTGPSPSASNVFKRNKDDFVEHYRERLPEIDTPDFDPSRSVGGDYDVVEVKGLNEEATKTYLDISAELFSPEDGPFYPYDMKDNNCAAFSHEAYQAGGKDFVPEPGNMGENVTRYPRDLQEAIRYDNGQSVQAQQRDGEP